MEKKEKNLRHMANLTGLTGFWHGIYWLISKPQHPKEKVQRSSSKKAPALKKK